MKGQGEGQREVLLGYLSTGVGVGGATRFYNILVLFGLFCDFRIFP